jgi:hypothetical protein
MAKNKPVTPPAYGTYVAQQFEEKAALFDAKDKEYGDNYLRAGRVLAAMFPNSLALVNEEGFNRFALLNQMVNKLMRYSSNFSNGGHPDSLDDLAIYAMMTKEADEHFKKLKEKK